MGTAFANGRKIGGVAFLVDEPVDRGKQFHSKRRFVACDQSSSGFQGRQIGSCFVAVGILGKDFEVKIGADGQVGLPKINL